MQIKSRIKIASAVLIMLFIAMELFNRYGNHIVSHKTNEAYLFKDATMHLQGIFRGLNKVVIDEGEPLSIQLTKENITGFEEAYHSIKAHDEEYGDDSFLDEKLDLQWINIRDNARSFLTLADINIEDDETMIRFGKLSADGSKLLDKIKLLAAKSLETADSIAERIVLINSVAVFVIVVLIVLLLFHLYHSIILPIKDLNKIAKGFEDGDLSILMNDSSHDEFGTLALHFNAAVSKLSNMILKVKELTVILGQNSKNLAESSLQIAKNAKDQYDQTNQAATATEELSSSFVTVTENTSDAASAARNAANITFESSDIITNTAEGMNKIAESVKQSANNVEELRDGSEQISEIVKVIDEIAGQTNLLALNAAIEAARAGEQGRGFSVVADEVRKLAERTTSATSEISTRIGKIQENTGNTVDSLENWSKTVINALEKSGETGHALQNITVNVNDFTHKIEQIAATAEEQSVTGETIAINIESIAKLSEFTSDNAQTSSDAATLLTDLVFQLQDLINDFTLQKEIKSNETDHALNIVKGNGQSNPA